MANVDINEVLGARNSTHGDYADHARATQYIKRAMVLQPGWERLNDMQRESLEMIAHKIGRILAGDPNYHDHWVDISGYSTLILRSLGDM